MNQSFRKYLKDKYLSLISFGIDPIRFKSVIKFPYFVKSYIDFKKMGGVVSEISPVLSDLNSNAGSASGDYFHQDLLVAQQIFNANPSNHLDIGSRVDGFVAHVASFRQIHVMDIRPLKSVHNNIIFVKHDLMDPYISTIQYESVSCLHAIEHFGLGRYGDKIDPHGHISAFNNMLNLVSSNGVLYISFPISIVQQTVFNQQRYMKYDEIFGWSVSRIINLENFDFIDPYGNLHSSTSFDILKQYTYGCGIYKLRVT